MTTPTDAPTLTDDTQLLAWLSPVFDRAASRELWMIFLDDESRPVGPMMPMDDYPANPHEVTVVDDVGPCIAAALLANRFATVMEHFPDFAQVVVVWERPGPASLQGDQLAWARAFGEQLRTQGVRVRAQLLLHDLGLRIITPDDLQ